MHAFSPDAARTFAAVAGRAGGGASGDAVEFPTTAEEIWRYSRIEDLDLAGFVPGRTATTIEARRSRRRPGRGHDAARGHRRTGAPDVFADLNLAFMTPLVLRVPAGQLVAEPIVIEHAVGGEGAATAAFPASSSTPAPTARSR